jgi:hypothetical protein
MDYANPNKIFNKIQKKKKNDNVINMYILFNY